MLLTLLALLVALIALLAIPVALDFRVEGVPIRNELRLGWAFGLVNVRLREPSTVEAPEEVETAREKKVRSRSNPMAALRQAEFRQRLFRFARDLWRAVEKEDFRFYARLGTGDPAETGQLWALLGPVSGVLRTTRGAVIEVEPDFEDARLEFSGSGRVTIVPLEILGIVLALAVSPPIWRGLRAMRA